MLMDLAGSRGSPRANCAGAATHNHRSAISKRRCALRQSARPDQTRRAEAGTDNRQLAERWYGMDERRRARGEEGLDEKICVLIDDPIEIRLNADGFLRCTGSSGWRDAMRGGGIWRYDERTG